MQRLGIKEMLMRLDRLSGRQRGSVVASSAAISDSEIDDTHGILKESKVGTFAKD